MFITQVRNATLIIKYAGVKFLIDPIFAEKNNFSKKLYIPQDGGTLEF